MRSATWPPFRSLPPYYGGKRELAKSIFAALDEVVPRRCWPSLTLLDPFLGGGAVSLFAKAQGFEVHCNDIALRSHIVGKALIENSETRLAKPDLLPLFEHEVDHSTFELGAQALAPHGARFLAAALPAALAAHGPQRWLLLLVLETWILRCMPMSSPAATDAAAAAAGDFDRISPNRIGHYLRAGRAARPSVLWRICESINSGVLPGNGTASQLDAVTFLERQRGDVLYLDPPYPGTTAYETEYALLDRLLEGSARRRSDYSATAPPLDDLMDVAERFPTWLISYGGQEPERLVELVRERRPMAIVRRIPYRHLASLSRDRRTYEYVITATR